MRLSYLATLSLFLFVSGSLGATVCKEVPLACANAELIVRELRKNLPQVLSQNLTMTHVMRVDAAVHLYVLLSYDEKSLRSNIQFHGGSLEVLKINLDRHMKNSVCSEERLARVVNNGVNLFFHYKYSDGYRLGTFLVRECV